jgi:hypothetical protein
LADAVRLPRLPAVLRAVGAGFGVASFSPSLSSTGREAGFHLGTELNDPRLELPTHEVQATDDAGPGVASQRERAALEFVGSPRHPVAGRHCLAACEHGQAEACQPDMTQGSFAVRWGLALGGCHGPGLQ